MDLSSPACANDPSIVLPDGHALRESEIRLRFVEFHLAEMGARIAGLEGIVFAMQRQQADFDGQFSELLKALSGLAEGTNRTSDERGSDAAPRRPLMADKRRVT